MKRDQNRGNFILYSIYENDPAPRLVLIFHTRLFKLLRAEPLKRHIYFHFRSWLMKNVASQQVLRLQRRKSNLVGRSVSTEDTVIQQFQISPPSCVYISDSLDFSKRKRQWNSGQNSPKSSFRKVTHVLKFAKIWLPDCCWSNAGTISHEPDASQYTSVERLPLGCITPV